MQIISCKAMRYLIAEHVLDDIDYFKPLLQQYTYYDDPFLYQKLISSYINSFDFEIYDDKNDNPITEIIKYLSNFLHEQISNEKTKASEKDTFLYFAGILMLQDPKSYGKYYEDDIMVALDLLHNRNYTKGPAAFFVGSSSFPNRSISKIIIENVPRLIDFALDSENDWRIRRSITDSLAIIVSNPLYKVLLPNLIKFRDYFMNPSQIQNEEQKIEEISSHIVIAFYNLIPYLDSLESEAVGKLISRVIFSTTNSAEFEICLKIQIKLMKHQKLNYSIIQPVITAILDNQLPIFFGIPVYLYNGDSSTGTSANRISKYLTHYIKTASSQNSIDLITPIATRLLEWLPLSIDFTFITVFRPIVECIKLKCITDESDIETIINLLLEIPEIILPKDFPDALSSAAEALSLLFESHPNLFQPSKLLDFCTSIDLSEFIEEIEEEEESNEEEEEGGNEEEEERAENGENSAIASTTTTESSVEIDEAANSSSDLTVIVTERDNTNGEEISPLQPPQRPPNRRERRGRRNETSSELILTPNNGGSGGNNNDDEDDADELTEACEKICPFKVKIVFLCFVLKNLNSIDDEVQNNLFESFDFMFIEPKLGVSRSLLKKKQSINLSQFSRNKRNCTTIQKLIVNLTEGST